MNEMKDLMELATQKPRKASFRDLPFFDKVVSKIFTNEQVLSEQVFVKVFTDLIKEGFTYKRKRNSRDKRNDPRWTVIKSSPFQGQVVTMYLNYSRGTNVYLASLDVKQTHVQIWEFMEREESNEKAESLFKFLKYDMLKF